MAYLLVFFLAGQYHFIPGIASEQACKALAIELAKPLTGVNRAHVESGKCLPYAHAWK